MKSIAVAILCISAVELINFKQFSDEIAHYVLLNNYDVAFVDWTEPLLDSLVRDLKLPKTIYSSSCEAFSRSHVLYFLQNTAYPPKKSIACLKSHTVPIIFHRNSSNITEAVRHASTLLGKLRIAKAIHVIYHSLDRNLTLIPYGLLPFDKPHSIANLMTPSESTNLHGYVYKIHYTKLYPFSHHKYSPDGSYRIMGLDHQLIKIVTTHQNATIHYGMDPRSNERCPSVESSVDLNMRRSGCLVISPDRLHLPDWDGICVVVPKRYERPVMLQFTKPFLPSVWILVLGFLVARFFCRFNRWRLLLLAVVLTEFMLTASYEVKVIEYMSTLRYAPNPRTMTDLINRGEQFIVGPGEVDFLKSFGSRIKMKVTKLSKDVHLGKAAMLYFCLTAESLIHTKMNYNPRSNDRIMILLPERLTPYPASFGFAKGHPLRERFERMLNRVFESGIWRKIYDQYRKEEQQFQPLVAPNEYLIEFKDFEPLWMVCGVGWTLSLGTFVVEKIWNRVQTRRVGFA